MSFATDEVKKDVSHEENSSSVQEKRDHSISSREAKDITAGLSVDNPDLLAAYSSVDMNKLLRKVNCLRSALKAEPCVFEFSLLMCITRWMFASFQC